MPEIHQIETFVLVSEVLNLAAVARKLNISSAAVSKQLTHLENELGLQLLNRTTRKVTLTDFGVSYALQCRRILEELAEASALVSNIKSEPSGKLRVVSARYFAKKYIVPRLKDFLKKYPKIELDLELAERIPDINEEGIDLLIGMSISASGTVIQKRIKSTSYSICASPLYLKKHGKPKNETELKNHFYIGHSMRKEEFKATLLLNDTESMLSLAISGVGIVKMHRYMVEEFIQSGELIELFEGKQDVPLYVAYPQRKFISSKVRCFIDYFSD